MNSNSVLGPLNFKDDKNEEEKLIEVPCLLCNDLFNPENCFDLFVKHLFEVHNLVIEDIQNILDFKSYIKYWKDRFNKVSIETIIPSIDIEGKGIKYFLISTLIKEDKKIREELNLKYALSVQEMERSDATFKKQCLFCRLEFEGTRPDYINHLSKQHNLQLGNPQNLVFIDELVKIIEEKLSQLQCIYCEKLFPNRSILKEHMRKKIHKRINPANVEYDRFFIVNYLEDQSNKRDRRNDSDEIIPFPEENSDTEYFDWEGGKLNITCLFCKHAETDINSLCLHMHTVHKFNFPQATAHLEFYQRVKLVNFIRRKIHIGMCPVCEDEFSNEQELYIHLREKSHCRMPEVELFDQHEYYFPTYENDAFLIFLEDLDD